MNTLFIGQNILLLKSVDSTNSYASELLRQNAVPDGTIVYTQNQTNGRGQRGNGWESAPDANLALSLILYPRFLSPDKQFYLTQVISLAVADVLAETLANTEHPPVSIKWPNDIYIGERKVAGILIENSIRDHRLVNSIVGIGINLDQTKFETAPNAVSLKMINGISNPVKPLLEQLSSRIESYYLQLKAERWDLLKPLYLKLLYRMGKEGSYRVDGAEVRGKITGVSDSGKLQLDLPDGRQQEFDLKEIQFI